MYSEIEIRFNKLKAYCEKEHFKGWDPYDGLNSMFFQSSMLSKSRFFRLAWIQFFKRSPINFRKAFKVPKDYNAKGVGLFLNGYCNLYKLDPKDEYLDRIFELADLCLKLKQESYAGSCWGYNFDWQARAFFQPKNTPTVVATSFVSSALLDAFEITKCARYLETAIDSKGFILSDLNRTFDANGNFSFSYSPLDHTQVFNASLLASRLLSQIYAYTKDSALLEAARRSVSFCCDRQHDDGSWSYGTLPFHHWIDNFHTGYNLECISTYQNISHDLSFSHNLEIGLKYYLTNFFTDEGIPKYYNNQVYPIDVHASSQLILTLSKLGIWKEHTKLLNNVLNWTLENMQDESGYFYYQLKKSFNSRIPYMRWGQAWMFYSLSTYLLEESKRGS